MRSSSASISVAIHLAAVLAMAFLGAKVGERLVKPKSTVVPLVYHPPARFMGGGGQRDPLPPMKGRIPPPPARRVFVPPMVLISNPKLPVSVAVLDAPPDAHIEPYGDPLGKVGSLSGGPGGPGGIGTGCCGGDGPGKGPRAGAEAKVSGEIHPRYSSPPKLIYKVEPEYPDEARKSRYQGTVVLSVDIDARGNPSNMRVVRGLGLGLDERALSAVSLWKFQPASAQGKPVSANVVVEVSFRLL
jgi:periplasmic protein TonB